MQLQCYVTFMAWFLQQFLKSNINYTTQRAFWWRFYVTGNNKTYWRPNVKCPIFLPVLYERWDFPDRFSLKVPKIKFQVNPSGGSCADTCGQSDRHTDRRTDEQPDTISVILWRFNVAGDNKTYFGLQVKFPIFLTDFNETWIFIKVWVSNITEIRQVGADQMQGDGRMDGHDETVDFCVYAKAPKTRQRKLLFQQRMHHTHAQNVLN